MCFPLVLVNPSLIRQRMQMEERERNCFGTEGCIITLAAFQVLFYTCVGFIYFLGLATVAAVGPEDLEPILQDVPVFKSFQPNAYALLIFLLAFMLCYHVLGVVMGVLLLRGVTQRNLKYLKAWTFYAICSVAMSFCEALFGKPGGADAKALFQLVATCAFYGLCDLFVQALILEIRASRRKDLKIISVVEKV
ncbi:unnamed protein product [Allacma fusca]|uniref:Uncharacterized protein n=1 Tax=Allacma fusca TaxID=39272 RepID=A0A8J2LAB0_9HEXA|nr:unnamed protein product [Allacma fusca]